MSRDWIRDRRYHADVVDIPIAARQTAVDNAGVAQLAERQLPKLNVAGSNPVTRFTEGKETWAFQAC